MILITSPGDVGDIKIKLRLLFQRKFENRLLVGGTSYLIESAINVKKSLNLLTTVSGSKVYIFCDISQSPKSQCMLIES